MDANEVCVKDSGGVHISRDDSAGSGIDRAERQSCLSVDTRRRIFRRRPTHRSCNPSEALAQGSPARVTQHVPSGERMTLFQVPPNDRNVSVPCPGCRLCRLPLRS